MKYALHIIDLTKHQLGCCDGCRPILYVLKNSGNEISIFEYKRVPWKVNQRYAHMHVWKHYVKYSILFFFQSNNYLTKIKQR